MSSEFVTPGQTPLSTRLEQAQLRAQSQTSHYTATTSTANESAVRCDRCLKPLNRWHEACVYEMTAAAMLAEDVLFLLDLVKRVRNEAPDHIKKLIADA